MSAQFSAALPLILPGLVLLAVVLLAVAVWLLARRNRKTTVMEDSSAPALARDVLDEGAAPAQRNQALIDAAPAAVREVAAPTPAPVVEIAPVEIAPVAETPATANDIARIKGVGPKLVAVLSELGVTTVAQVAAWGDADIERIDAALGRFKGRITRDQWVEQAKLLSAGDDTAFVAKFGKNG